MSTVAEHTATAVSRRRPRSGSDLVSLSAPVFDLVLKLRTESLAPSPGLRVAAQGLLQEIERRGATLRYADQQIKAVKFALTAFVDETVLTTNFPLREEWEKFPLQLEYFGESLAGVKFFERLDELLKQIEADAEVVEVYYLCLLLGFKGKYKVYMEDQLQELINNTAAQLKRVGRLQESELSPHWKVRDQPEPPRDSSLPLWAKVGAAAGLVLVVLIYLVLLLLLTLDLRAAEGQLTR
jgi:type VI secretion system protein ImpK